MKLNIGLNAGLSVAETLVNGLCLFALYAYVNRVLGVSDVGIWALVLATGSLTRIADFGLGQGLQRKIAVALAAEDRSRAIGYVETAVVAVALLYALLLGAAYYPATWALRTTLRDVDPKTLHDLLQLAFVSFWVSQLAWMALFGLCGTHRVYLKCAISMVSNLTNVVVAMLLIPKMGIIGLGLAQLGQSVLALTVGAVVLRRALPGLCSIPLRGSWSLLRELASYGWKLQAVALLVLSYEPVTKFLLGRFFGTEMVGLYELATRMVQQVRLLIAAPNNALVPTFAAMGQRGLQSCLAILRQAQVVTNVLGTLLGLLLIGMLPVISEIWIGRLDIDFVIFASLLSLGWFFGLYAAPSYYLAMALDEFRWILVGHLVMVVLNVALCVVAGFEGNARWLVVATNAAFVIASLVWLIRIPADHGLRTRDLFAHMTSVVLCGFVAVAAALWVYASGRPMLGLWGTAFAQLVVMSAVMAVGLWFHPQRSVFVGDALGYLSRRRTASGESDG